MRDLKRVPVFAAGLAAICLCTAKAEPFDPEPFQGDKATTVIRIGGGSYLGVNLREIDSERAKELKLREEAGVEITRVEEDSPAAKAGIKAGDVVIAYNGQRVEGMEQFSRFVRETPAGREVKILISRDGNSQTLSAKVGARKNAPMAFGVAPRIEMPAMAPMPAMPDLPRALMMWRTSALGIEAESLHGQMAEFFGVKEGVLVRSVMKDTPAAKAGIKVGDVILKVDDTKVSSPSDVTSAIHSAHDKKAVTITLMRDRKEMTISATIEDERGDGIRSPRMQRINGSVRL